MSGASTFAKFGNLLKRAIQTGVQLLRHTISVRTTPMRTSLVLDCLSDLVRSQPELIAENATPPAPQRP
jgi:hypothetical protein